MLRGRQDDRIKIILRQKSSPDLGEDLGGVKRYAFIHKNHSEICGQIEANFCKIRFTFASILLHTYTNLTFAFMLRPRYNTDKTLNSRKADIQPLKESLQALVNAYKLQGKLNEVTIVESWEKIMGKAIAIKTQEIYFRHGKLFVRIASAPLKHELVMAKTKVIDLINAQVGVRAIEEVVFL